MVGGGWYGECADVIETNVILNFQYNGHPTRLALKAILGVHLLFKLL